jgi:hypothetical protein
MEAMASLLGSLAEAMSMWRRDEATRLAVLRNRNLIAAALPVRAQHPRHGLYPGRGPDHLPGLRRRLPAEGRQTL